MSAFIFRLSSIHRRPGWVIFIHILRFSSRRRDEPRRSGTKCHTAQRPRAAVSVSSSLARASLSDIRSPASRSSSPSSAPLVQILEKQQIPSRRNTHSLSTHTHTKAAALLPLPPFIVCHLLAALRSASSDLLFFPVYSFFPSFCAEEKRINPVR